MGEVKGMVFESKDFKNKNFLERISFIKYWARYIKSNSDEKWSKGQTLLIDSQLDSAQNFHRNFKDYK